MKILHTVEFYYPSVGGMQEVVKQLSERLVKLGHEVTVATTRLPVRRFNQLNGVVIEQFDIKGNLANGLAGEIDRYQNYLRTECFDVITNFAAQQWATDAMILMLGDVKAKKVFVPTGFSGLHDSRYNTYFASMSQWMKHYDMNVFLSEDYRDINFARKNGVEKILVIPNGASEEEFLAETSISIRKQFEIPANHLLLLHVGSHTGLKGHSEAISIFANARLRNATLLLVANDFADGCSSSCQKKMCRFNRGVSRLFDDKKLIITSLSREKTIAAYKDADLFIFPSNIECSPLVLFECMASRTPFLTSYVGNAVEISRWSQSGLVLPTYIDKKGVSHVEIKGSAKMLEELAQNVTLRHAMGEKGFSAWQKRFTWGEITRRYEELYIQLTLENN